MSLHDFTVSYCYHITGWLNSCMNAQVFLLKWMYNATCIWYLLQNSSHCSSYAFRCPFCSSVSQHREVTSRGFRIRPESAILTYFWVNISGKACACTDVEMGRFLPIWFPHIFLGLTRLSSSRGQEQITSVFHTAPTRSVLLICAPPHMLERAGQGEDCYIWWFVFASWSR